MTFDDLKKYSVDCNINLSDENITKLKTYCDILLETNKVMNLTAIKDESGVVEKHFLDSLMLFRLFDFKYSSLLDIGTGAGFPGVVIALLEPSCKVTLLDATTKKINFLQQLCTKLELTNVDFINSRVEKLKKQRESFDYVTARAFAALNVLIEVGVPLLKVNGKLIAMKSSKADEEITQSRNALHKLEAVIVKKDVCKLAESKETRVNLVIEKREKSPKHFPRSWEEISSKKL